MSAVAKFENLKDLIVELRGQSVLLDSDVAELYRVETKRINEAVKNNPDKFPHDYMLRSAKESLRICGRNFRPQNLQRQEPYLRPSLKKVCT